MRILPILLIILICLSGCSVFYEKNLSIWINPFLYNLSYNSEASEVIIVGKVCKTHKGLRYDKMKIEVIHQWKGDPNRVETVRLLNYRIGALDANDIKPGREYLFFLRSLEKGRESFNAGLELPIYAWGYILPVGWDKANFHIGDSMACEKTSIREMNDELQSVNFERNISCLNLLFPENRLE